MEKSIKELRHMTGLTQTEFGKRLGGIPLRTIQNWENGVSTPPKWALELIRYRVENDDDLMPAKTEEDVYKSLNEQLEEFRAKALAEDVPDYLKPYGEAVLKKCEIFLKERHEEICKMNPMKKSITQQLDEIVVDPDDKQGQFELAMAKEQHQKNIELLRRVMDEHQKYKEKVKQRRAEENNKQ